MARRAGKNRGVLSGGEVFSYSLGDVANNLTFMMTSMFLMVYMTDIAGLSAGVAGTIYGVTKVWAGVADLIAGRRWTAPTPAGDDYGPGCSSVVRRWRSCSCCSSACRRD